MDIPKISFDEAKYGATFDDLDVNKDGVINNDDATAATDETVKATILQALADVDEDPTVEGEEPTDETTSASSAIKTEADITKAADDLKAKYPPDTSAAGGDAYSMNNGEMVAFKNAMDDGFIATLSEQGFSAQDIVKIVSQAFPTIGIAANDKGGYTCPYGHGDAKALYDKFTEELGKVTGTDVKALQAEVAQLNVEITNNNAKLTKLKGTIETLKNEVEKAITEAIEESEEIKEEQKQESAAIVKEELDAYANSEGDMTYDDFQGKIKTRLDALEGDGSGKLSAVIFKLMKAESNMAILENSITQFGVLVDANKQLADKIKVDEEKIVEAEECPACEPQRCDPIGFESQEVRYDFFIDKDNNGDITNETEFLGAQSGWAEMVALDKNNDGKITADEMEGLKMVATDADGNQTIKDASELFNDDSDFIDLSSYQNVNKDFENGNTLLGTFSANIDGQTTDGYNTLDTLDWLDDTYAFTDEDAGINRFAKGNTETFDITDFSKEFSEYQTAFGTLSEKMTDAWNRIGITRTEVSGNIVKSAEKQADRKAEDIAEKFKTELKAKEEQEKTEETPPVEDETDPLKKPEEE